MLIAALASVVIASCYDGDTCTTTTGERIRLACIDTPELVGKRAKPMPAKAARDQNRESLRHQTDTRLRFGAVLWPDGLQ